MTIIGSMTIVQGFGASDPVAVSVSKKLDLIESGKARPGSVFRFKPAPQSKAFHPTDAPPS